MQNKWILRGGVLLTVGALLNVAVAFGCTLMAQRRPGSVESPTASEVQALLVQRYGLDVNEGPPPLARGARVDQLGYGRH